MDQAATAQPTRPYRVSVFLITRLLLFAVCVAVPLGMGWLVGWLCSSP